MRSTASNSVSGDTGVDKGSPAWPTEPRRRASKFAAKCSAKTFSKASESEVVFRWRWRETSSFRNRSLAVKQGDQLRVDGWYWVGDEDARLGAMPAGPHLGVMAYWYGVFADL